MTVPVGTHGLTCLTATDYGAIALYLQTEANAIDSALAADAASFATYYLRPTVTAATTANSSYATFASRRTTGFWAIGYNNMGAAAVLATGGVQITAPKTGWYQAGTYMNMIAAGAVNLGTERTIYMPVRTNLGAVVLLTDAGWRGFETNTGGEFVQVTGNLFYVTAGTPFLVTPEFTHSNTSSNVVIQTGAKLWCTYIGSGVTVVTS